MLKIFFSNLTPSLPRFPTISCLQLDKGVSVRKSVVRTLRGVLLWRKSHPRHNMICRALVERAVVAREEDTIRDLIRDTFQVRRWHWWGVSVVDGW